MEFRVFSSFNLVMEKKSLAKTEAIYQALYTMEQLFLKSFFFFFKCQWMCPSPSVDASLLPFSVNVPTDDGHRHEDVLY